MHIETERKYLIKLPPTELLVVPGGRVLEIVQTYLSVDDAAGEERRVRLIEENGEKTYIYTEKKRISDSSRYEDEREITEEEYDALIAEAADPRRLTKTRYAFPFGGHTVEIDIYPPEIGGEGLEGHAVLEIELDDEREIPALPDFISVDRELTGTKEFSNKVLAKPIKSRKNPVKRA